MARAEAMTRAKLSAIPDGSYTFTDYLDNDGVDLEQRIAIQATVTIQGSDVYCDFTGTSPQVRGPLNCVPTAAIAGAYYVIRTITDPTIPNASTGIWIDSSVNVEISNNEISGWTIAAIEVRDQQGRIDLDNGRGAVRIIGNQLRHNQFTDEGYGVEVSEGAYALIERNVFTHNRHAMAGDGSTGSGYFFVRNYIGTEGGDNGWNYSHQVDQHGTGGDCGLLADGKSDILWRHDNGVAGICLMDGGLWKGDSPLFNLPVTSGVEGVLR